jgi:Tfp pilus assembly protein PilO
MSRRGPIVAAALGVVMVVLLGVGLILPKMGQVKDAKAQVATTQATTQTLQVQLASLEALAKQATKIRAQLAKLNQQVPVSADLPGLIRDLNAAAAKSAVDFISVSPGTPTPSTDPLVSMIPLQVTVNGGFFAAEEFLYQLETLPRTAKVATVAITTVTSTDAAAGGSTSTIPRTPPTISLVITATFYTDDLSSGPGSQPGTQKSVPGAAGPTAGPPASGGSTTS